MNVQRIRKRTVALIPEIDDKLARYAKLRQQTPEQVAAVAIEQHLREHAEQQLRVADARRIAERYRV